MWKKKKKASDSLKEFCDESLTIEDTKNAIQSLKPNKLPGNDGLTSEFYFHFSSEVSVSSSSL